MKRIALIATLGLLLSMAAAPGSSAEIKAGSSCKQAGLTSVYSGRKYLCIKQGKKLVWNKGVAVSAKPVIVPTALPGPSFTPGGTSTRSMISKYTATPQAETLNPENCKISIPKRMNESLAFPRVDAIPTLGNFATVVIFVDFPDLKSDLEPIRIWKEQQVPIFNNFYRDVSYGKMNYKVELIPKIFRISNSILSYNLDSGHGQPMKANANLFGFIKDAVAAADEEVDFSKYEFINVVTPNTNLIGFEGAVGLNLTVDNKNFRRATFGPIREYMNEPTKYLWFSHEVGHLMGFTHPYYSLGQGDNSYKIDVAWDLMGSAITFAPEFLAWHRFLAGWFDTENIRCLNSKTSSKTIHFIEPLSAWGKGVRMGVIKLSETEVMVIENRRKSNFDKLSYADEGVFVYIVDSAARDFDGSIKPLTVREMYKEGYLISTLRPQESVRYRNVEVKILESLAAGDSVQVTVD